MSEDPSLSRSRSLERNVRNPKTQVHTARKRCFYIFSLIFFHFALVCSNNKLAKHIFAIYKDCHRVREGNVFRLSVSFPMFKFGDHQACHAGYFRLHALSMKNASEGIHVSFFTYFAWCPWPCKPALSWGCSPVLWSVVWCRTRLLCIPSTSITPCTAAMKQWWLTLPTRQKYRVCSPLCVSSLPVCEKFLIRP